MGTVSLLVVKESSLLFERQKMKKLLLLLAVATFVSAEAQIPFAGVPGLGFPLIYYKSHVSYQGWPCHHCPLEGDDRRGADGIEADEKIECINNEGSVVPCVHGLTDVRRPADETGLTDLRRPAISDETGIECINNEGSVVPCVQGLTDVRRPGWDIENDGEVKRPAIEGSDDRDPRIECINNEGSVVPCVHGLTDVRRPEGPRVCRNNRGALVHCANDANDANANDANDNKQKEEVIDAFL